MNRLGTAVLLVALISAGCGASTGPVPTATPAPQPSHGCAGAPVAAAQMDLTVLTACGQPASAAELRVFLVETFGERWYCDPDEYPVSHGPEQQRAIERFGEMRAEGDVFNAVAASLAIDPGGALTDAQRLAIYHRWKQAITLTLDDVGNGRYRFDYTAAPVGGAVDGVRTSGTIAAVDRTITDRQTERATAPNCPICLTRGTLIDAPGAPIAVEALRVGDVIWTLDGAGRHVRGTVTMVASTPVPADHRVVHLTLRDGRTVTASPGHPLADGRPIGDVRIGDVVDPSVVTAAETIAYGGGATFDLVVAGDTGIYLAGGIPLRSTLTAARVAR